MNFDLEVFGTAIATHDVRVGDLFKVKVEGGALLCLRSDDDDSVCDIVLAADPPTVVREVLPYAVSTSTWDVRAVLKFGDDIRVRASRTGEAAGRLKLQHGTLIIDNGGEAFVVSLFDRQLTEAINLKTGKTANPIVPCVVFSHWEIVVGGEADHSIILASFPPQP